MSRIGHKEASWKLSAQSSDSLINKDIEAIIMPGSTRFRDSAYSRPTTAQSNQLSPPHNSPEDSRLDNRLYTLPHHTKSLQGPTPQVRMYLGNPDYDPGDAGLMASTGRFSSTCVFLNQPRSLDDSVEPHVGRSSSSTRLQLKQKESNGSPCPRNAPLFRHWKWEILSILTSLGLLCGVLVTLARYNNGKQPEWPYNININSLVSVLTAVIVAQLGFILAEIISQLKWSWFRQPNPLQDLEHYDSASRGILGALLFLGIFARKPRAYLAMGAAFVFLLSAAIGPFTQQSIKTYACQRPLHNISASISAAVYVNSSLIVGRTNVKRRCPNWNIRAAALEGIVNSANNNRTVRFDCPTGDCDFAPYSSLAYCSSCNDITSHVQEQHGSTDSNTFPWNYTLPGQDCQLSFRDASDRPRLSATGATGSTPTHLTFCSWDWDFRYKSETGFTIMSLSWANCSQDHDDGFPDSPGCGDYPEQLPSLSNLSGLVAMNCTLGLCVRDYTSRVRKGVLVETVTNSLPSSMESDEAGMYRTLKLPCIVDSNLYDLSNISQVPTIPGRNFTTVTLDGQNVTAPLECVFTTEHDVPWAIGEFVTGGLFYAQSGQPADGPTCSMISHQKEGFCDPWYLEPMFRDGRPTAATISSDMDGIADALSNQIRAVGSNAYQNGSGVALGTAIQTTVCVHVEWAWLLFPAALVLITTVLFIAMLIMARRCQVAEGQPIWKSSSVVAFSYGIDARPHTQGRADGDTACHAIPAHGTGGLPVTASLLRRDSHEDLMTLKRMHAKAKKVVVKLETAGTGQRGFIVVKGKEDDTNGVDPNKHHGQRHTTDSRHDGEALPLTQLPNNGSLREQAPAYLDVDLGIGLTPSIRSSLDRSFQTDFQDGFAREN